MQESPLKAGVPASLLNVLTMYCMLLCSSIAHYIGNARQMKKKMDFKQHYLESVQNLSADVQRSLLASVLRKELSIPELQEEGKKRRALRAAKDAFLRLLTVVGV